MTPDDPLPGVPDTMSLHCPKCPRPWWRPWRKPLRWYRRVTEWTPCATTHITRFRCDGCGFEHPFTASWVKDWAARHA